ncbi:MAG: prepilin-type N-terminal cleavage/methylation domain-containing protein [bacterium]|nr:prepilin-type N-terminal cleavage/methylation domain-containing protein [bacterium]
MKTKKHQQGFTLVEILVAIALFAIVGTSIYFAYSNILNTVIIAQYHLTALTILDNEVESIRNMPYEDIGTQGGAPAGKLLADKDVTQGNATFNLHTTVRNIDDPFDGQIGAVPNDLAPADYRLVELEVGCGSCGYAPVRITTSVAPKNLEGATSNGALFVNVFDAFGNAVSNAQVAIVNTNVTPNINISDTTNSNGMLQLVDIATSSGGYEVTVTKSGYSSDRTYPLGGVGNPNPTKPHGTVAKQQVTAVSFAIDRVSTINFKTTDQFCAPVPDVDFSQTGSKLIGTDPNVLKYSATTVTDSSGNKVLNNLEWDTYSFQNLDSAYEVSGTFNLSPFVVDPNTTTAFNWMMEAKNPMAVLVTVKDQSGQLINDAKVTLAKAGFTSSLETGHREFGQTDWSGGQYSSKSFDLEANLPSGELGLKSIGGSYASSSQQWLVSSTFDLGTPNTTFYNLHWTPTSQPPASGPDSLRIQLATNNDNNTWNFVGPDGTAGTYYTVSDTAIVAAHSGNRYLRYKVFMQTVDDTVTPRLTDLMIGFRSTCIPDGQVYFRGLSSGTYTMTIEKSGFQTFIDANLSVNKNWQDYRVTISP